MKLCGVCNKPIEKEWPNRHDYHEYDCPNFVDFVTNPDAGSPNYPCDCNLLAHPECCPQCNKQAVELPHEMDNGYDLCDECHSLINKDDVVCPVCFP